MEIKDFVKVGKIVTFGNLEVSDFSFYDNDVIDNKAFEEDLRVKDFLIKNKIKEKKILDSIKMVNASDDLLLRKLNELSSSEILKVKLMKALLLKKEVLVFVNLENYFTEKEILYFKKLFKKLAEKYDKAIVLFSKKVDFMFDLSDFLYLKCGKKIKCFTNKDYYNEEIYKYLDMPKIVDFVLFLKKNNKKLDYYNYIDLKELLKAIYREV